MRNSVLIGGAVVVVAIAAGVAWLRIGAAPERAAPPQPVAAEPVHEQLHEDEQQRAPDPTPALRALAAEEDRKADEIVGLVQQGKVGHARALADQFYRAYPKSPRIVEIERLTGYHPRPYGP